MAKSRNVNVVVLLKVELSSKHKVLRLDISETGVNVNAVVSFLQAVYTSWCHLCKRRGAIDF